jgi:hypothetical protein
MPLSTEFTSCIHMYNRTCKILLINLTCEIGICIHMLEVCLCVGGWVEISSSINAMIHSSRACLMGGLTCEIGICTNIVSLHFLLVF